MWKSILFVVLCASTVCAAPVPKDRKKASDAADLVGTWNAIRFNGRSDGTKLILTFDSEGIVKSDGGGIWKWTLTLEETPKRMFWKDTKGNNEWKVIYELNGDNLTIGFIPPGAAWPDSMQVAPGVTLYEMRRQ